MEHYGNKKHCVKRQFLSLSPALPTASPAFLQSFSRLFPGLVSGFVDLVSSLVRCGLGLVRRRIGCFVHGVCGFHNGRVRICGNVFNIVANGRRRLCRFLLGVLRTGGKQGKRTKARAETMIFFMADSNDVVIRMWACSSGNTRRVRRNDRRRGPSASQHPAQRVVLHHIVMEQRRHRVDADDEIAELADGFVHFLNRVRPSLCPDRSEWADQIRKRAPRALRR